MCRILCVAGIKPAKTKQVWDFVMAIAKPMSQANSDGLGYAAITAEGDIFGERWLNNDHAFGKVDLNNKVVDVFKDAVNGKKEEIEYNSFGKIQMSKAVAITLHTRYATSPKGMKNTHPFVDDGISLIHNGVISNDSDFKLESTCDSEAILRAYQIEKVAEDAKAVQAMADSLKGYYACGVLTKTAIGPTLDIFKSNASLHVAYVKELETFVVSTSDSDIKDTCRLFGYTMGSVFNIFDGKFIRVNAITGKETEVITFKESDRYRSSNYSYPSTPTVSTEQPKTSNVIIYDKGKRRENTPVSQEMLDYFQGKTVVQELDEREIQEYIMQNEQRLGTNFN